MNQEQAVTARITTDVLVVGSGIAGMSAAATAVHAGATVTVLEKLPEPGGSSALSAGMYWTAPDVKALRERIPLGDRRLGQAIVDEYDESLTEIRSTGIFVADEPVLEFLTFGIGYRLDIRALLEDYRHTVEKAGGRVLTGHSAYELILDSGRVCGARARRADGAEVEFASEATVLATGGFQGDPELLNRHIGPNADRLVLRSNRGSVGDGLRLGRSAGAGGTRAMHSYYGHLLPSPLESFEPKDFLPLGQFYSDAAILVNRHGRRFVDESQGDEITNQALTQQPEAMGVLIYDDHVRQNHVIVEPFPGAVVADRFQRAHDAGGRTAKAETLDEIVAAMGRWGVPRKNTQETIEAYAAAAERKEAHALEIPMPATPRPPSSPPFYAVQVQPSITFTFGGLPISLQGEVLDPDGRPIPGLFAAGADIGGFSNGGYGGGLAPSYMTGRWAGSAAAARAAG